MRTSQGQAEHSILLTTVLELISDGIWDWDANTGTVCRSDRWFSLLGYQPEELPGTREIWEAHIHADDHGRVIRHLQDYIHNRISHYQIEYRFQTKKKQFIWIEDRGKITDWNEDGSVARMIGAFRDINLFKNALDDLASEKRSLEELVEERTHELINVNAQLEQRIAQAERMAETDPLTGIANRYRLEKVLDTEVERASRFEQPLSIIAMDIDNFKLINDKYGHANGDMVLVKLSRLIKKNIREIDLVARWGGDEFMLILPNTTLDAAMITAEKLRMLVANTQLDKRAEITSSFGVAQIRHGESAMRLAIRVDNALYQSKDEGKNRIST